MASWTGKWAYPVPPTATRSVKTEYGALNTLAVELRDKSIVSYVNGRPVATAELPDEQRTVVTLSFVDGLSHSAIAEQLSLPLGTVKSRIFAARKSLKESLEGDET